jgi:[ribosomal protein S18]-alanine N-acetyltransferase
VAALYTISPLTAENAWEITTWSYDPPYDLYDLAPEHLSGLLTPEYRYHQVTDQSGSLVGYCCFGLDAQVPGGDYRQSEPEVLDIGVGLKPSYTGRGYGVGFVRSVLGYAAVIYHPAIFRATVAGFNHRSLRTFQNLGFEIKERFIRELVEIEFFQLERQVKEKENG